MRTRKQKQVVQPDLFEGLGQTAKELPPEWKCFTQAEVDQIVSKVLLSKPVEAKGSIDPGKLHPIPEFPQMTYSKIVEILESSMSLRNFYLLLHGLKVASHSIYSSSPTQNQLYEIVESFTAALETFEEPLANVCLEVYK